MSWIRFGAIFFVLQGAAATVWWLVLLTMPGLRRPFLPVSAPDEILMAFLLPDLVLFIGASFMAGWGLVRRCDWVRTVILLHLGASAYGSLYCLALSALTNEAWLSVLFMLPATIVSAVLAWRVL